MTSARPPRVLAIVLATLVASGVAGCSNETAPEVSSPVVSTSSAASLTTESTSTPGSPSSLSSTSSSSGSASASSVSPSPVSSGTLAEDQQRVVAEATQISFGVPEAWLAVDPSALKSVPDEDMPGEIMDMAKAQGLSTREFLSQLATQMDLMVIAPEPQAGFSDNVNVLKATLPGMPSQRDIEGQLKAIRGTLEEPGSITSALGTHPTYRYTMPTAGMTVYGMFVLVEVEGDVRILTVSAGTPERLDAIVDGLSQSLELA